MALSKLSEVILHLDMNPRVLVCPHLCHPPDQTSKSPEHAAGWPEGLPSPREQHPPPDLCACVGPKQVQAGSGPGALPGLSSPRESLFQFKTKCLYSSLNGRERLRDKGLLFYIQMFTIVRLKPGTWNSIPHVWQASRHLSHDVLPSSVHKQDPEEEMEQPGLSNWCSRFGFGYSTQKLIVLHHNFCR